MLVFRGVYSFLFREDFTIDQLSHPKKCCHGFPVESANGNRGHQNRKGMRFYWLIHSDSHTFPNGSAVDKYRYKCRLECTTKMVIQWNPNHQPVMKSLQTWEQHLVSPHERRVYPLMSLWSRQNCSAREGSQETWVCLKKGHRYDSYDLLVSREK